MVDQNTSLWVFAICTTLYIFWIDYRPKPESGDKLNRLKKIGKRSNDISAQIAMITSRKINHRLYKREVPILIAEINSVFTSLRKKGFTVPDLSDFDDEITKLEAVEPYTTNIGQLLSDGHNREAKNYAKGFSFSEK